MTKTGFWFELRFIRLDLTSVGHFKYTKFLNQWFRLSVARKKVFFSNEFGFVFFFLIENNLMGAAEWTGYTNSSPTYPTPTYSALPPSGPAPPSAASYGYEIANMDHPSNFHIPTSEYCDQSNDSHSPQSPHTHIRHNINSAFSLPNSSSRDRNAIVLFLWISSTKSSCIGRECIGIGTFIIVGWQ